MSSGTAAAPAASWPLTARLAALVRNAPQRLRERAFWIIQVGVLSVTGLHVLGEWWAGSLTAGIHPALHHVPVILYLAPIAYASLRYGIEGAVLTGVWSAVLTTPNIVLWHAQSLEWLTELVYVAVVASAGVVMAVPVERERLQRRRAEATSRRLAAVNEVATLTLTADLQRTLEQALAALTSDLGLHAACVAATDADRPEELSMLARHPADHGGAATLQACIDRLSPGRGGRADPDETIVVIPFETDLPDPGPAGRVSGVLAVHPDPQRPLSGDDQQLLTAVSNQLALALANARLTELERDRVRSYARLVTWAQEEERKRISRELHDETAQSLVAIRRELDVLSAHTDGGGEHTLQRLRALTGQTLTGLRRFSHDLRPPVLDDLGPASALESLVADLQDRSDLTVDLTVTGHTRRLPAETELALFRIAQSALHNAERHAHATHATVEVAFQPDRVRLAVTDDGRGFKPPADLADLTHGGKLGLLGMHERARLVGSTLDVVSAPGHGTRIELEVPC